MDPVETPQAVETPPLGTPTVHAVDEATSSTPAAADDSLAAHEAAHGPHRSAETDDERDEKGKFKPRRRAVSQHADADDVPVINELTKRLKAAEEAAGKDIVRKDGESERVFNLRRRAEIAERLSKPSEPPKQAPAVSPAAQPRQAQPIPQTFPSYEQFIAIPGNEAVDYDTYRDIRDEWGYQRRREIERQAEAAEREQLTMAERIAAHDRRLPDAKKTYADWDTVVTNDLPVSRVVHDAVLASDRSRDVQYFLGKNRDMLSALNAESTDYSPSAVAAMRRYLDTLVASATSSPPTRAAAGQTGAVLTLAPPPAPKPPTPVRTGAVTTADDPPDDNSQSLAAHEKFFGRKRA